MSNLSGISGVENYPRVDGQYISRKPSDETPIKVSDLCREIRRKSCLSAGVIAKLIGTKERTYESWEKAIRQPNKQFMEKLPILESFFDSQKKAKNKDSKILYQEQTQEEAFPKETPIEDLTINLEENSTWEKEPTVDLQLDPLLKDAQEALRTDGLNAITDEELAIVLHKHKCWVESGGKEGEQAELIKFNLGRRNLSNANLEKAKLNGSHFYKTNLRYANLKDASMRGALLIETKLDYADLSGAVLRFAKLKRASCTWTRFEKGDLFRTNFELAEIEGANFVDVKTGDKSLEQILKVAKINSIYTNNLPNQKNMVQIVEDADEPFNVLENISSHKEENFNDEDVELTDKSQNLNAEEKLPLNTKPIVNCGNSLKPTNRLNLRVIVVGLTLAGLITSMFLNNMWQSKATAKTLDNNELGATNLKRENTVASNEVTPTQDSSDEEIPYLLEFNPNDIKEDPTVILGVGNVTTLDLEEQPKEIIAGDKEVIEISKSTRNPKRLYLIGKTGTSGSNLVIETTSGKTLTIFFKIVEHASLGDFNGEVKISTKVKEIS